MGKIHTSISLEDLPFVSLKPPQCRERDRRVRIARRLTFVSRLCRARDITQWLSARLAGTKALASKTVWGSN